MMKTILLFFVLITFNCIGQGDPLPNLIANKTQICPKQETVSLLTLNAPSSSKYQWFLNNKPIVGATTKHYETNVAGKYHVEVTPSHFQSLSPSPTMLYVNDVFFLDDKKGWAVGVHGKSIKTIDGGNTWLPMDVEAGENENFTAVAFLNEKEGYILGKKMYSTTDGGIIWQPLNNFPPSTSEGLRRNKIQIIDKEHIYVKASFTELTYSADAGKTWNKVKTPSGILMSFAFKNVNEGLIVETFGSDKQFIYKTIDAGKTWTNVYESKNGRIRLVNYIKNSTYYINNIDNPILLKTTDDGNSWSEITVKNALSPLREINNLHFLDENIGVVVNSWGRIYKTVDGGDNWELLGEKSPNLSDVLMLNNDEVIAWKNGESTIWKNTGFNDFTNLNIPFKKRGFLFNSIKTKNNSIWITSRYGDDFTFSNDNGKTWKQSRNLAEVWTNRISFIDDKIGWYLADGSSAFQWVQKSKIYQTKDGGTTWTRLNPFPQLPNSAMLRDVTFINENEGWICGEKGIIINTKDAGNTWNIQLNEGTEAFQRIFFIDNQTGWALGPHFIYKTTDGGKNWIKKHTQSYPITNYGYSIDIFFLDKNNGWVCGGLYPLYTNDGGETWNVVLNSSLALGKAIQFINKDIGFLTNSSLWTTVDGGKNWELSGKYFSGADIEVNDGAIWTVDEYNEVKKYIPHSEVIKTNTVTIKKKCFIKCWCKMNKM